MAVKLMQKFKNWRYVSPSESSVVGTNMKTTYQGRFDDDGVLVLDKVGEEDFQEYIQSFAESVDINTIIAKYGAGDTSVLERVQGFYFDATSVPDNMAELLNKLNRAEEGFEKLPPEFKEKYGNDFNRFLCTFDPSDLVPDLDQFNQEVLKEEEKSDES